MKSKIQQAREAGYSDEEISQFLSNKNKDYVSKFKKAQENGYSNSEILDYLDKKEQPSRARSLISAPIKGAIEGVRDLASTGAISSIGPINLAGQKKLIERVLPTQEKGPEKFLERAGRIAPLTVGGPGGLIAKGIQTVGGALGGHIAEENEVGPFGQAFAELGGMSIPNALSAAGRRTLEFVKRPIEKLPSGITKPTALSAKYAEKGIISPERQEKAIKQLNDEAAKLAQQSVQRHLSKAKDVQAGRDFQSEFKDKFSTLQKSAERANPTIDITDVSDYLNGTAAKYRGFPKENLPQGSRKVLSEVRGFQDRPQLNLKNLLKLYRFNNDKLSQIYETRLMSGKQREYADFITGMNRNIVKSFERTLPADSGWLKEFKGLNRDFKEFKQAERVLADLRPILEGTPKPSTLTQLAENPKKQKMLEIQMGKNGADEIIQIAKDTKGAIEAIRRIPAKEWKLWEQVLPFSILIPGLKIPGIALGWKKVMDYGRRGYGLFLTTPARRKAYANALSAIKNQDHKAYVQAAQELKKSMEEEID